MDTTVWCPLTDKPCMGRQCACAVMEPSVLASEDRIDFFCGLVNQPTVGACRIIDHKTMDDGREAQS